MKNRAAIHLKWACLGGLFSSLCTSIGLAQSGPPTIVHQPQGVVVMVGQTATVYVEATGTPPLEYHWRFNGNLLPGEISAVISIPNVASNQAGAYSVVVNNTLGTATSAVAQVTVVPALPGVIDGSFITSPGANEVVRAMLPLDDGKILIGGGFTEVQGISRGGVARLESNGSVDRTFDPGQGTDGVVYALARQNDGKVLIGGDFTNVNGTNRNRIARLDADGGLDLSFDPGDGPNAAVWSIAVQKDGKILIGGDFWQIDATNLSCVARLDKDGRLDTSFAAGKNLVGVVRCLTLDDNGKVMAAGSLVFPGYSPPPTNASMQVLRWNTDGSLDTNFSAVSLDYASYIFGMVLQPDGAAVIGGGFTRVNGETRARIARVTSEGKLDPTFAANASADWTVTTVALQADGRILVGGGFYQVNGTPRLHVARLNGDGSLDPSFETTPGPTDWVEVLAVQKDGRILMGGNFEFVNGVYCGHMARLVSASPPPFAPVISESPGSQAVNEGLNLILRAAAIGFPQPDCQWQFGGASLPDATNRNLTLFNVRPQSEGDYAAFFSNAAGSVTSAVAHITVVPAPRHPGAPDIDFYSGSGPNGPVYAVARGTNDSVLIGGFFSSVNGVSRQGMARLRNDGSLDPDFHPTAWTMGLGGTYAFMVQPDGKILAGGQTSPGLYGNRYPQLIRLNQDGSADSGFTPFWGLYAGAWGTVFAVGIHPDGSIYLGGQFGASMSGRVWTGVVHLQTNGALDTNFVVAVANYEPVYALAVQNDGKVIIGGGFTSLNGLPCNRLARLDTNGTLDASFNVGSGANSAVSSMALDLDGKLVIGGQFTRVNGRTRCRIARLNSDGTLDDTFDPGLGPNRNVSAVSVQPDGQVLVGGAFTDFDFFPNGGLVRLRPDGSLDVHFSLGSGANEMVRAIALMTDGKVVIGGDFVLVNGVPRSHVARLLGATPPNEATFIAGEPQSQVATAGADVTFRVTAGGIPAPTYQWYYNAFPLAANQWWLTLRNVQSAAAGPYRVRASSPVGSSVLSAEAWLTINLPTEHAGAPDIRFYAGFGPNDRVNAVLVQKDRRVVIGGEFTEVDGTPRHRIARLDPNGNLDSQFDPGQGANHRVLAMAPFGQGQILIGGEFTAVNGVRRSHLALLNSDGSLDMGFDPGTNTPSAVLALAVQADQRILVGGLPGYRGTNYASLTRLLADGSADGGFSVPMAGTVRCLTVETNGSILVGGDFNIYYKNTYHSGLVRLDGAGHLDTEFFSSPGPNQAVQCVSVQPDGKILIGGQFNYVNGIAMNGIARLNANGTIDSGFTPGPGVNGTVYAMAVRGDGRIVVAGSFAVAGGLTLNRLARFNGNGTLDLTFDPGLGATDGTSYFDEYGELIDLTAVQCLAVSEDGTLVIGGDFGNVNGMARSFVARIFNQDPAVYIAYRRIPAAPGFQLELRWESGRLQEAQHVEGPYVDVPAGTSPHSITLTNAQRFYRVH